MSHTYTANHITHFVCEKARRSAAEACMDIPLGWQTLNASLYVQDELARHDVLNAKSLQTLLRHGPDVPSDAMFHVQRAGQSIAVGYVPHAAPVSAQWPK